MSRRHVARRQRGVALITALLVVAIAATAATALARQQQLAIQRSSNVLNAEQAWLYALGAETFAHQVLRRDAEDGDSDHPGEGWATLVPPTAIDGGATPDQDHIYQVRAVNDCCGVGEDGDGVPTEHDLGEHVALDEAVASHR